MIFSNFRGNFTPVMRLQNSKLKMILSTNYRFKLVKACFQHDMAFEDFKDLPKRAAYDKVLCDKSFSIAKNPKYDGYQQWIP